ncbi:MAG: SRPBCC family protein [Aureliella sp.]
MFLSESHLPQVLSPAAYSDPAFYDREKSAVFAKSWHLVAVLDDLPGDGGFLTTEIADLPVVVWRDGGRCQAFVNVCAHRFCTLTDDAKGCTRRLRCQYHGWEYDTCGDVRKIPDSQSFRPLKKGQLALTKLRTVTLGKAVLVNTELEPESTEQPSATLQQLLTDLFTTDHGLVDRFEHKVAANWKVVVENAVESYHVGCVHADSFAAMPTAETCQHELSEQYTKFETDFPSTAPQPVQWGEKVIHRALGREYVEKYTHYHFFPTLMISTGKMFSSMMSIEPLGPAECRLKVLLYGDPGPRRNPIAWAAFFAACTYAKKEVRKIIREDLAVLPSIQKGIQSPKLPGRGLISVREERVNHFQRYISSQVEDRSKLP